MSQPTTADYYISNGKRVEVGDLFRTQITATAGPNDYPHWNTESVAHYQLAASGVFGEPITSRARTGLKMYFTWVLSCEKVNAASREKIDGILKRIDTPPLDIGTDIWNAGFWDGLGLAPKGHAQCGADFLWCRTQEAWGSTEPKWFSDFMDPASPGWMSGPEFFAMINEPGFFPPPSHIQKKSRSGATRVIVIIAVLVGLLVVLTR